MSFAACLSKLRDEGVIDAARFDRYGKEYERLRRSYGKTMGGIAADDLASRDTLGALEFQAIQDRRQKLLQIRTQQSLVSGVADYVKGGGKAGRYAIALMDHHEAVPGVSNVSNRRTAVFNSAYTRMNGFLQRYGRDMLNRVRNAAELDDVVRALRGETVDSAPAREMAAAVADTFEWLRQQFNLAGGNIARLKNWGLPQTHDAIGIAKAGLEPWKAYIKPLLSMGDMIDNRTGKAFTSEDAFDEALDAAWANITSEGMDGAIPGAFNGSGKVANRGSDHRFLVFKDADAWLAYNQRFGNGDIFDAINGHIASMSSDIAAMQILGPNPALTVRWMVDVLKQSALPGPAGGKAAKIDKKAYKGAAEMDRMWRYYSGEMNAVSPEDRATARVFSGIRNWNTSSMLGSAFTAALPTDPIFTGMTAKFNGLDATKTAINYVRQLNPADASHRAIAEHAGLVFSEMTQRAERLWREGEAMRLNVHELSRRAADLTMRASLLSPHTVAMKKSVGLSFMMDFAANAGHAFDKLDRADRLALARYGIDAKTWDAVRSTPLYEQDGVKLLRPGDVQRRTDIDGMAASLKLFEMIDSETRFAVPGESLRAQTMMATLGGHVELKRGGIISETIRSATQFKTYGVIALMTHWQRALYGRGGMSRSSYALTLPILLTLGGYAANALWAVSQGREAPEVTKDGQLRWDTVGAAMVKGGGFGMAGDFITAGLNSQNSQGGTIMSFAAGPTISRVLDPAINLTLTNIGQAAEGKDTNIAREALRMLTGAVPGNNIWYLRAAFNRGMLDEMQAMVDPDYRSSWRRMEKRAKDQGMPYREGYGPGDWMD